MPYCRGSALGGRRLLPSAGYKVLRSLSMRATSSAGVVCGLFIASAGAQPIPAALQHAIDEIRPEELRRDLVTVAADEFRGRGAGYPGEKRAAEYAAQSFAASGLEPLGDARGGKRGYLQAFVFYPKNPPHPGA